MFLSAIFIIIGMTLGIIGFTGLPTDGLTMIHSKNIEYVLEASMLNIFYMLGYMLIFGTTKKGQKNYSIRENLAIIFSLFYLLLSLLVFSFTMFQNKIELTKEDYIKLEEKVKEDKRLKGLIDLKNKHITYGELEDVAQKYNENK